MRWGWGRWQQPRPGADIIGRPDRCAVHDSDRDADPDCDPWALGDADDRAHADADANDCTDGHADTQADALSHPDVIAESHSDAQPYADTQPDAHALSTERQPGEFRIRRCERYKQFSIADKGFAGTITVVSNDPTMVTVTPASFAGSTTTFAGVNRCIRCDLDRDRLEPERSDDHNGLGRYANDQHSDHRLRYRRRYLVFARKVLRPNSSRAPIFALALGALLAGCGGGGTSSMQPVTVAPSPQTSAGAAGAGNPVDDRRSGRDAKHKASRAYRPPHARPNISRRRRSVSRDNSHDVLPTGQTPASFTPTSLVFTLGTGVNTITVPTPASAPGHTEALTYVAYNAAPVSNAIPAGAKALGWALTTGFVVQPGQNVNNVGSPASSTVFRPRSPRQARSE